MDLDSREGEAGEIQKLPFIEQSTIVALERRIQDTGLENFSRGILLDFAITNNDLSVHIAKLIVSAYKNEQDYSSFERGLGIIWHAFTIQFPLILTRDKLRELKESDYTEATKLQTENLANTGKLVFPDIPERQFLLNTAIKNFTTDLAELKPPELTKPELIKDGANLMYQFLGATWYKLKPS